MMAKVLGLDLRTNSVGWAIVDTATNQLVGRGVKIFPGAVSGPAHERRRLLRAIKRKNYRFAHRFLLYLRYHFTDLFYRPAFIDKLRKSLPALIHCLLALLLAGSLLMAVFSKEFQFWFNLTITVLLGWIAVKK